MSTNQTSSGPSPLDLLRALYLGAEVLAERHQGPRLSPRYIQKCLEEGACATGLDPGLFGILARRAQKQVLLISRQQMKKFEEYREALRLLRDPPREVFEYFEVWHPTRAASWSTKYNCWSDDRFQCIPESRFENEAEAKGVAEKVKGRLQEHASVMSGHMNVFYIQYGRKLEHVEETLTPKERAWHERQTKWWATVDSVHDEFYAQVDSLLRATWPNAPESALLLGNKVGPWMDLKAKGRFGDFRIQLDRQSRVITVAIFALADDSRYSIGSEEREKCLALAISRTDYWQFFRCPVVRTSSPPSDLTDEVIAKLKDLTKLPPKDRRLNHESFE